MGDKTGHYRFDPYNGIRNPFPTVGSTPGDVPEDLTYIRQSELDRLRAIERRVRELADELRSLPLDQFGMHTTPLDVAERIGDRLRALIDAPEDNP